MEATLYIFAKTIKLFLSGISLCMFMSIILQFFVDRENSKAYRFFATVSEVFVYPFRVILAKLHLFEGMPIDMAFLIAYLSLSLVNMILPAF